MVRKIWQLLFSWTLCKWKQMMFLFIYLFCLVFGNENCLGGDVLISISNIQCEISWMPVSHLLQCVILNIYLALMMGWSNKALRRNDFSQKSFWNSIGLHFQVCSNLNCVSLKRQLSEKLKRTMVCAIAAHCLSEIFFWCS